MKRVIHAIAVGYDGSAESVDAVRWGASLAALTQATLNVVHAVGLREHIRHDHSDEGPPQEVVDIADDYGIDLEHLHWFSEQGDACSVLLRCAGEPLLADVLVVGSRGSGKRAGMLIGSTSLELAQHARVPVVVVPATMAESTE